MLCISLHRDPKSIFTLVADISKTPEGCVLDTKYQTQWNLQTNDARPLNFDQF